MITVSDLYCYPIKSCGGVRLTNSKLRATGLEYDRSMMLVRTDGRFVTQREFARLCVVGVEITGENTFRVSAPEMPELVLSPKNLGDAFEANVWSDTVRVVPQSTEINNWFTKFLGEPVQLVAMHEDFRRPVDPVLATTATDEVGFADGFSMLLISQPSLDDLNQRLDSPVPMDRFRPNIVVTGCEPFAEDQWRDLTIGGIGMKGAKPCARCGVVSIDQSTADRLKEPGSTLAKYRRFQNGIMFGMNLIHHATGELNVGDVVEVSGLHSEDWIDRADFA